MNQSLKTKITSLSSLAELNEVIALCNEVKKLNAKTSLVEGAKVYVVQKTKRTLGTLIKVKISYIEYALSLSTKRPLLAEVSG